MKRGGQTTRKLLIFRGKRVRLAKACKISNQQIKGKISSALVEEEDYRPIMNHLQLKLINKRKKKESNN